MVDKFDIENKALEVLEQYNITEPVVDVVKIAEKSSISVKEIAMPKEYGDVAAFYDEAKKTIYVEVEDKPWRKLFSIAHELGHVFLGHRRFDVLFRIPNERGAYSKEEKEANIFAANLLMPEFMVRKYLEKYNLTRGDYDKMAKIFGVSYSGMKVTLERLQS